MPTPVDEPWWRSAVVYQVYPRSFADSDGDGVGDLVGLRDRLPYLAGLGVDAVWISPIYPSPMADFGYDVVDHRDVDPRFGTLADLDAVLDAAHELGMRVLLDLVPSHTSEQHPWFRAARSSRDDPHRDWYVWADPGPDGGPPNNWVAEFDGPAWTWDDDSGQYYLHFYLPQQPALNWRNPDVAEAMLDVVRFWFDRGVDGFRVDAVEHLVPDAAWRDNPEDPDWTEDLGPARRLVRLHTSHQPEAYEIARSMRAVADQYAGARLLVGEAYGTLEQVMGYYGDDGDGFHLPFNFTLIGAPWDARRLAELIEEYEGALPEGAWPNWVLGNHDRSRIASRVGPRQARVAAVLLLTLRGTPTIYQGDELGMVDVPIPPDAVRDPWELRVPGLGLGRDPVRTPIRWDDAVGAGFTTSPTPWLPLGDTPSVAVQRDDPRSMLELYRALLALRRDEPALALGQIDVRSCDDDVLVYERRLGDRRLVVALNLSSSPRRIDVAGTTLLTTAAGGETDRDVGRGIRPDVLGADEGRVIDPDRPATGDAPDVGSPPTGR